MEKIISATKDFIFKNKEKIIFLSLILFSFLLLVFGIEKRAFWMDETAVLEYMHNSPLDYLIHYFQVPDNHPPLYYFLVIVLYKIFPFGEFGVRLLSVLSGIGIAITAFYFSKMVFKDKVYAYLSFLLVTISSYFVMISQMARYHALTAFLAFLALYFFCRIIFYGYSKNSFISFLALSVAVGWTDYPHLIYLILVLNACMIYLFMKKISPISFKKWALGQAALFISFIPMLWLIYSRIVYGGDGGFTNTNLLGNSFGHWLAAILMHFYAFFFGENIFPWNYFVFILGSVILVFCASIFIYNFFKNRVARESRWIALLLFAFVFINVAFMNFADPRYNFIVYPKYGFVAFPLFILFLVGCLKSVENKSIKGLLIVSIIFINIVGLSYFYQRTNYLNASYFNDFSGFEFVKNNAIAGDYLIITGDANIGVYEFYKDKYFQDLKPVLLKDVDDLIKKESGLRLWFFSTGSDDMNVNNVADNKIPDGLTVVKRYDSTPIDRKLKEVKEKVLGRESYIYKNGVFLLTN